jgi:hypothetical protein
MEGKANSEVCGPTMKNYKIGNILPFDAAKKFIKQYWSKWIK